MTAMKRFEPLDLIRAPLEGVNLAEASAGTGKTYAISALFVRLIVECGLDVNEILVVTFTEAATEELKDRIRTKLRAAVRAFEGEVCGDVFLSDLVGGATSGVSGGLAGSLEGRARTLHRLREALRAFDQAGIYTIHGFCRRVLQDNAFESGRLFDTELVAELDDLKSRVVYDFWRRHFYHASPLFVNYVLRTGFGPDSLRPLLSDTVLDPYLRVIPHIEQTDAAAEAGSYLSAFEAVQQAWLVDREEIKRLLAESRALNRNRYRPANIQQWVTGMDRYVRRGGEDPSLFDGFDKFTRVQIEGAVKKGHSVPQHPFFDTCQRLKETHEALTGAFDRRLISLKRELVDHGGMELAQKKEQRNVQTFHDLLLGVHEALAKAGGQALAAAVRRKYKVALIDEFQDTDPIQYGIFQQVFGCPRGRSGRTLYFIGDPKQAIYGFRSADIFAYMAAAKTVHAAYTLGENWRSEPGLVHAVNTLFARVNRPFIYEQIPFQPVAPAPKADRVFLTVDGKQEPPFHLWFLDVRKHGDGEKALNRSEARDKILRATAGEISRLIDLGREDRARIGDRPIREGDIAVLVRTNPEARQAQEILSASGITSVVYTSDDLFASAEAEEMERILSAIAEPNHAGLLGAALATDILGQRAETLDEIQTTDRKWEEWILQFTTYHELWRSRGVMAMFRRLLTDQQVMVRLMTFENGERRNTNVRHLCEVLHQASFEHRLGMTGLLKWFRERRSREGQSPEEHQLRLESDENAVKLVTVHKSKGLEYPIVFCPFIWDGLLGNRKRSLVFFHNPAEGMKKTLDLGSQGLDEHCVQADEEALAEDLRLLYVALTRAKNRCYTVWGRISGSGRSAPAYLFHQGDSLEGKDKVTALQRRFDGLSDEDVWAALQSAAREAEGAIRLVDMPIRPAYGPKSVLGGDGPVTSRRFSGRIDDSWGISSFSSIAAGRHVEPSPAEGDEMTHNVESGPVDGERNVSGDHQRDIFDFPAGAGAGSFMHAVFEALDFGAHPTEIPPVVAAKLAAFGFDSEWTTTICDMVKNVLSVPLPGREETFTLSEIGFGDRLNELEFYFPINALSGRDLATAVFQETGVGGQGQEQRYIDGAKRSPSRGFMRGFVDLVFRHNGWYYIADWKSNFLGPQVLDYDQERLQAVMMNERYTVQYLIYAVALNQYLARRVPDYDYDRYFGGVFYLFVRGMDPGMGNQFGVYGTRPDGRLIRWLSDRLMGRVPDPTQ